jgi:hypothetical protein
MWEAFSAHIPEKASTIVGPLAVLVTRRGMSDPLVGE